VINVYDVDGDNGGAIDTTREIKLSLANEILIAILNDRGLLGSILDSPLQILQSISDDSYIEPFSNWAFQTKNELDKLATTIIESEQLVTKIIASLLKNPKLKVVITSQILAEGEKLKQLAEDLRATSNIEKSVFDGPREKLISFVASKIESVAPISAPIYMGIISRKFDLESYYTYTYSYTYTYTYTYTRTSTSTNGLSVSRKGKGDPNFETSNLLNLIFVCDLIEYVSKGSVEGR
jgi:hypothetical protein